MGEMLHSQAGEQRHPDIAFDNDRSTSTTVRNLAVAHRLALHGGEGLEDPKIRLTLTNSAIASTLGKPPGFPPKAAPAEFAAQLIGEIIRNCGLSSVPPVVGFKCTHLMSEIDLIGQLFEHRTIVMVRDPRDILASNIQRIARTYPLPTAFMILNALLGFQELLQSNDERRFIVRYEDLIHSPVSIMTKVLQFIGIDPSLFDWSVLNGGTLASNSSYNIGKGIDLVPGTGVDKGSVGRYRTQLSHFHQYVIELLMSLYMRQFGYGREVQPDAALDAQIQQSLAPDVLKALAANGISAGPLKRRLRILFSGPF